MFNKGDTIDLGVTTTIINIINNKLNTHTIPPVFLFSLLLLGWISIIKLKIIIIVIITIIFFLLLSLILRVSSA